MALISQLDSHLSQFLQPKYVTADFTIACHIPYTLLTKVLTCLLPLHPLKLNAIPSLKCGLSCSGTTYQGNPPIHVIYDTIIPITDYREGLTLVLAGD